MIKNSRFLRHSNKFTNKRKQPDVQKLSQKMFLSLTIRCAAATAHKFVNNMGI